MNLNFTTIYLMIGVLALSVLIIYAWRHAELRGTRTFAISCFTSVLWMSGDVVGFFSSNFEWQYAGQVIRYAGVTSLPVTVFVFTRQYCGKKVSAKQILLLSIIPAISYLIMITSLWHTLFFTNMTATNQDTLHVKFGVYFWFVHTPYCYLMSLISILLVLLEISRISRQFRAQIIFLAVSLLIPLVINCAGLLGLLGKINYTSLSFPVFLIVVAIGIFRYKLLGSSPIAYETVFQTIKDGVIILDRNDIVIDINPTAAKGAGKSRQEIIGMSLKEAFSRWHETVAKYENERELQDEIDLDFGKHKRFFSISITPLEGINNTYDGRIITFRDITDNKRHQLSLETLAFYDPLTRLANRRKFQEEVETALEKSALTNEPFAILYFDLNRFKTINDTMGHEIGDELLKYVAARIASILRKPDILARLGGDEFVLLLHNTNEQEVKMIAERILENVQRPFKINEHTLVAGLSIGAAFHPEHGKDLTELLRHADAAMYLAKSQGGGLAFLPSAETITDNARI